MCRRLALAGQDVPIKLKLKPHLSDYPTQFLNMGRVVLPLHESQRVLLRNQISRCQKSIAEFLEKLLEKKDETPVRLNILKRGQYHNCNTSRLLALEAEAGKLFEPRYSRVAFATQQDTDSKKKKKNGWRHRSVIEHLSSKQEAQSQFYSPNIQLNK